MTRYEDECVGCPREMGCLGSSCSYRNVSVRVCDDCGEETDTLYVYDGLELCWDCFVDCFECIDDDMFLVDGETVYIDDLQNYCEGVITE